MAKVALKSLENYTWGTQAKTRRRTALTSLAMFIRKIEVV